MTERRRRAGNNQGSIYRRKSDGRWVGSVSLGMVDGKRRRKTVYGSTQGEVRKKVTDLQSRLDRGVPVRTSSPTVADYLDEWLESLRKQGRRPRTLRTYQRTVDLHLKPTLGRHRLEKLTQYHVQAMIDDWIAQGLQLSTVRSYRGVLQAALTRAMKLDLVSRNVATLTDIPPATAPKRVTLTPEGAAQLFQTVRGHRLEVLFIVAVTLGLRQGETLGLKWEDIDLEAGTLVVKRQLITIEGIAMFGPPKTKSAERVIPLPTPVLNALKHHRRQQVRERLEAGGRWHEQWDLVFCSRTGSPLSVSTLRVEFKRLLRQAGLPPMRWHDLRHSTASILGAWEVQPQVVHAILGHASAAITIQTYTHAEVEAIRAATDRMKTLFGGEHTPAERSIATEM